MYMNSQFAADLRALEGRLVEKIADTEGQLSGRLDAVRDELFASIDTMHIELNARINRLEGKIEAEFRLLRWMMATVAAINIALLAKLVFM